ncbi:MAG: hypothetical protein KatS3mg111_1357 [Pirellulaceae bacterium]|nr:MAG: hypothetical protein KatS3mg111_1357 [Pirellulaceae bacterium]
MNLRCVGMLLLTILLSWNAGQLATAQAPASAPAQPPRVRKLVLVAGKPSHPPRMHEFNAGVQLLHKCLANVPGLESEYVLNGWPEDDSIFDNADGIVFYMDGGARHEVVAPGRKEKIDKLVRQGVGIGCMHYAVEVVPEQAGAEFKRWIGGHYEHMFSCNPIWEPHFAMFPDHPIAQGVEPFTIQDEWYFNMRFIGDIPGNVSARVEDIDFTPILVAVPSDDVRDGPYVYPKGPYPHIVANAGRAEAMMWAVERPDGGRGFGFTGGHFHDNWANDQFRKIVLNALVWVTGADVPAQGVQSTLAPGDIDANLDPKPPRR